jgi:hypothetical protein
MAIGKVPLAVARNEALAANQFVADQKPSLVDRLAGGTRMTLAELLEKMPQSSNANTAKTMRTLDKRIKVALGSINCDELDTRRCADLVEDAEREGKQRTAQALRSRLKALCDRGMQLGAMTYNPADPTRKPEVIVQRQRLTLEQFKAIYAVAPQVSEWLQQAMMIALVTGADRATIASMPRACVKDGHMLIKRVKTGVMVAIPLALRLDVVGVSVGDVSTVRTGVLSPFLLHHVTRWGNAPTGSSIHPDRISRAFTDARKLAGIPDDRAPTFHEIRSLCKRLYKAQGGVDTKDLLGHLDEKSAALYADPRGAEPIMVKVG